MSNYIDKNQEAQSIYQELQEKAPLGADESEMRKLSVRFAKYRQVGWDTAPVVRDMASLCNTSVSELADSSYVISRQDAEEFY